MQRLFVFMCYSVILLFLFSACGSKEEDAVDFGKKVMNEVYTVDDSSFIDMKMSEEQLINYQNKFSAYFTEEEFHDLAAKRFFLIPLEVASKQGYEMTVQDIVFDKVDREQEEDHSIDYNHSFTIICKDKAGEKVDETEINGQISIVDTDDGLKIDRYYDVDTLLDILYDEK